MLKKRTKPDATKQLCSCSANKSKLHLFSVYFPDLYQNVLCRKNTYIKHSSEIELSIFVLFVFCSSEMDQQ